MLSQSEVEKGEKVGGRDEDGNATAQTTRRDGEKAGARRG